MWLRLKLLRLLRRRRRRGGIRPLIGISLSVLLHVAVLAALLFAPRVMTGASVKRGEPLFVELPNIEEPAPKGNPAARSPLPPTPPSRPARATPPAPEPPAPRAVTTPSARVASAPPSVAPAPPIAPAPPAAPAPRQVAAAPPAPTPAAEPAPTVPAPREAATAPEAPAPAAPTERAAAAPPTPSTAPAPSEPGDARVAALPSPPPEPPRPDIRSALRRGAGGGAGGLTGGRGGIEGEPIPLDTDDPRFSDYLDRVRRLIRSKWGFPCAEGNPHASQCVRREGELIIEFGITKDGHVPFVNLRDSSGSVNMDDFALNAVRLASPFPPIPDSVSRKGIPIIATFRYLIREELINVLR